MKVIEGNIKKFEGKIAIVVSRFNEFFTTKLLEGALDCLRRHEVKESQIDVVWVPGAFEVPVTAQRLLENKKEDYKAVICLAAVIRGATPHFDFVAGQITRGIAQVSFTYKKPVIYGVITPDTLEQATERSGTKAGNKGFQAAMAALEMIDLFEKI